MPRSATVRDLRRRNRAAVLRRLLRAGESTRATLAEQCSLSPATLTNVVGDLIAEGLVEEVGHIPSDGGRPIARLGVRRDSVYVIGADVGEHGITVELFDLLLGRVDRTFTPTGERSPRPETIRRELELAVATLQDRNPGAASRIVGLGLGVPGVVEVSPGGQTFVDTQSLGWERLPLGELFEDGQLPVYAENGAKAMVVAEAWQGAAGSARHCIAALIGRGVGAGFVLDGALLRGRSGSAGEWGHTKVAVDGRACRCGGRGCLEAYVGGTSILTRWVEAGAEVGPDEERELRRLIASAEEGDATASAVLDETVAILGAGLANLVNLFNPEVIVIGGWVGLALAASRMSELQSATHASSLLRPAGSLRLEVSELGTDAVALGAALLPIQQLVEGHLPAPATAPSET